MPNMALSFVGNLMITAHTAKSPSDEEWAEYVGGLAKMDRDGRLHLIQSVVFTEGGSPNSAQRRQVAELLRGRAIPGAVVSPSSLVRGVVTAMSWFNPKLKAFEPEQMDDAFAYVGLSPKDLDTVWRELEKLRQKLGTDALKTLIRKQPGVPKR